MILENEKFAFLVTHVEAEGKLLKIWAQTNEKLLQTITSGLTALVNKINYHQPVLSPENVMSQTFCCTLGINNDYRRIKIYNLQSDDLVLVKFLDYGNVTRVPIQNIRSLDNLPEARALFFLPKAVSLFILADVLPIGGSWLNDVVVHIRSILVNNKYYGIYQNIENYRMLKFTMMESNFSQILINRNMATYSPSITQIMHPAPLSSISDRTNHRASNVLPNNWRMPVSQNDRCIQKVVKSNSFKAIQLEIGSVHNVQISYVAEGPNKFSVQLIESIPHLNEMMEKINSQSHLHLQEPPIAGQVCLGKQTRLNRLCRIVLNSPGDTSCKVYYADYGYHQVLSFSDIYQIPDEFVIPNIFSIRFTLMGIMNWIVSNEMKDYFEGLICEKKLILRVCQGPMSPLTQYCELFLNGKSVKEILSEAFPELCQINYSEPKRLANGTRQAVFVSHVDSISQFFVQIEHDTKLLEEVMSKIDKASKIAVKLSKTQIYTDMPCIALYVPDQNWYRASILDKVDNDNVRVFYVDYGNQEVVSINDIRVIPTELIKVLPKQAIKCCLNQFQSEPISKELILNFEGLVLEERLNLVVISSEQNILMVDLFDEKNLSGSNKNNIAEKLKSIESSKQQKNITCDKLNEKHSESLKTMCELKAQIPLVQKQKTKNKNLKIRNNLTGKSDKEAYHQVFPHNNNFENHDSKSKFCKDNENERYDNRYKRGNSDNSNVIQNNRFDKDANKVEKCTQNNNRFDNCNLNGSTGSKDYLNNERLNRNCIRNNSFDLSDFHNRTMKESKNNSSPRSDGHFVSERSSSDKDSDTSSRTSGKGNNRIEKRNEAYRKHDIPTNYRNRPGRWENNDKTNDLSRKNDNSVKSASSVNLRLSKDNNAFGSDKPKNSVKGVVEITSDIGEKTLVHPVSAAISKIPPPNITVGAIKNCVLVYYNNPSSFYIQLCPDNKDLNVVMNKIFLTVQNGGKILKDSEIKPGLQCIAQYSGDEQWYRAIIDSIQDREATVHFVDYGNIENVSFNKIKEIDSEFLRLPAQAVHCKLFCPHKTEWTVQESELLPNILDDKCLEAEFVAKENGVYSILVKDVSSNNTKSKKYINNIFINGVDWIKEKEAKRKKVTGIIKGEKVISLDYAPLHQKWSENKLDSLTKYDVFLTWFINPTNFYCQLANQQNVFRDMMNEIQTTYVKRPPVNEQLQIGSSVIAALPDDGILYRAEIVELNKPRGHVVQYVDYGDRAMVDPRNIYAVEKKFMQLPKQAIHCSLANIACAPGSNWPNSTELSQFFNAEKFECNFHKLENGKYSISLNNNGIDISSALVDKNLAIYSSYDENRILTDNLNEIYEDMPKIDINLFDGQILHIKVSNVENVGKFYVQFNSAKTCQTKVDTFMTSENQQVIPHLSCHEVCLGAGCLVNCRGKWRRGVVVKYTKVNCEVRFIDTGEHEKISFNSMLGLPVQLAAMQKQAFECSIFNLPSSTDANETLKKLITEKDIKIFVEAVECNRLIVRLFDLNGKRIRVSERENSAEAIDPICTMQILNSTHEVVVSWINDSSSIWLQRTSEKVLLDQLLQELTDYYSKTTGQINVKENMVCAVLNDDGIWYRAKVSDVKGVSVTVILLDYGISTRIPVENIRALEARFYVPHQLSVETSLTVSLDGSESIGKNILEPLLSHKTFSATFFNVNRKWVVELTEDGEKISEKLAPLQVVKGTIEEQFEYTELSPILVGEKYEVIVSHISSPNAVWVQRIEHVKEIAKLQNELQRTSSPFVDSNVVPAVKSLFLALYSLDNQWYRAEVLDADTEITTVRFIDYGSVDVIDNSRSRLKQLPDKWKSINGYAISSRLDVMPLILDDWPKEACQRFTGLISAEKNVQALIIADKAPMRIDLFVSDKSVCQILVEEELATFLNCTGEFEFDMVEEVELDPRSAYVSSIDSVDKFWMQEDKYINELEMLQDRLMMASIFQPLNEVKKGAICIAYFPEDGHYYRAVVLSHNEEGTTRVRYIDYGNTASTQDLRAIPKDLIDIPPLSRKCRLAKPDGVEHWPSSINEEFKKLADEGSVIFLLDVIEEGEISLVKLTYEAKDVSLQLLELCEKGVETPVAQESIDKEVDEVLPDVGNARVGKENFVDTDVCTVCYAVSPSEFWIHKKSHYSELDDVMNKMLNVVSFNPITNIVEGKIVAAKFDEDGEWYRSKILSHSESGTEVFYIDYGNTAVTDSQSALRELPSDLALIPPLATCCSLKPPEDLESWPKTSCEKFMDIVEDVTVEFRFEILKANGPLDYDQPVQLSLFQKDRNILEIILID